MNTGILKLCLAGGTGIMSENENSSAKPRVFIAASTEGNPIASAIARILQNEAQTEVWNGSFELSSTAVESIENSVERADFAIAVMTADDNTSSRGQEFTSPRDNVLLELGMFMGRLGRKRTFVVVPGKENRQQDPEVHLPTDLLGVTCSTYDAAWAIEEPTNALSVVGNEILEVIKKQGLLVRDAVRQDSIGENFMKDHEKQDGSPVSSESIRNDEKRRGEQGESRQSFQGFDPSPISGVEGGWRVFANRGWLQEATTADIREGCWLVHLRYGIGEVLGFSPEDEDPQTVTMKFSTGTAVILLGMNVLFRTDQLRVSGP